MRLPLWVVLAGVLVFLGAAVFTQALPYWIALPFAVGWLAGEYTCSPAAGERSKRVVVLVTVWATATASAWPLATVPAVLALVGVGAYIIVHHDVTRPGA